MTTKHDIIDYLTRVHGFTQEKGSVALNLPDTGGLCGKRVYVSEYSGVVTMEIVDMDMGENLFKGRISNPEQAELVLRLTGVME